MKKYSTSGNSPTHLYNPKEEGLGEYDLNYINAYKKDKDLKLVQNKNFQEREAA
tara:strand:- start:317 stop:478 length:162 start_codon:yes stop_codon:yes gene_type:complete